MARATGANALLNGAFETTPGIAPGAGFRRLPFVSHSMGEERGLIASDLLGQGREMQDPTPDVATNVGDFVVPVDARNFALWLKLFFGAPLDAAGGAAGLYSHTFTSGAQVLPSASFEVVMPEIPEASVNYGCRGDKLKITMARGGLLNATCSLIGIGESNPVAASVAGNPASLAIARFAQATGYVLKDGAPLGSLVKADLTFNNNLDPVETIKADGRIEDSDPGAVGMTGSITVRIRDLTLLTAATNGTPMELDFGWTNGPFSLKFACPRVFLPNPKVPITGPKGIEVDFAWQSSGALGNAAIVTLINDQVTV